MKVKVIKSKPEELEKDLQEIIKTVPGRVLVMSQVVIEDVNYDDLRDLIVTTIGYKG